ncbi:MAG TPA: twin-arginine translocation signal domain-containing protein [Puia sp.]|jgi:hypothetical protein
MDMQNSRRDFLKSSAALAAVAALQPLTRVLGEQTERSPVAGKKIVGIQIGPESFVDEGVGPLLDWLQEKAAVNTLFLTAFTYGQGFAGRMGGGRLYPGHGKLASEGGGFHGGYFAKQHSSFFERTVLKDTRAPDLGDRDILAEVIAAAGKRGMKVFGGLEDRWDKAFDVPGLKECAEVDLRGRSSFDPARSVSTCVFNPNVRAFWTGLAADLCSSYAVDGILFLNERSGPHMNVLGITPFRKGVGDTSHVACFCEHHRRAALEQHIDFDRAKQGYERLYAYVQAAIKDQRPSDGYYVTYQQILLDFPEIVAYDQLCNFGKLRIWDEVRSMVRSIHKELPIVFHVEQTISFNPFTRASLDYDHLAGRADFLKPATYNNCAGERYADFIGNIGATIFRDMPREEVYSFLNHLLNYEGMPKFGELATAGLPPDYVARETRRALAGVKGRCGILSGIDISIPVGPDSRRATPDDSYAATMAALEAGAQGVVLSRKYAEMRRENLEGAGRAVEASGRGASGRVASGR